MRTKITFKSEDPVKIPFNYNYILSSLIYRNINDEDLTYELHSSNSYKFFTFSQLEIQEAKRIPEGFISENGTISFIISSPNENFLESILKGFIENLTVNLIGQKLKVEKLELIPKPQFSEKMEFRTQSPIITRIKKEIDGKTQIWDLSPGEEFNKQLEKNLIKKYLKFNNLGKTNKEIKIYSEMKRVKRRRISIKKDGITTYHRAYFMDIILEGNKELIEFAYDTGLGEKNSMGFGCIKVE